MPGLCGRMALKRPQWQSPEPATDTGRTHAEAPLKPQMCVMKQSSNEQGGLVAATTQRPATASATLKAPRHHSANVGYRLESLILLTAPNEPATPSSMPCLAKQLRLRMRHCTQEVTQAPIPMTGPWLALLVHSPQPLSLRQTDKPKLTATMIMTVLSLPQICSAAAMGPAKDSTSNGARPSTAFVV